jgi:hypothetical protein
MVDPLTLLNSSAAELDALLDAAVIEPAVRDVVAAANALGLPTHASCEGHRRFDPQVYVAFGLDYGESLPEELPDVRALNWKTRRRLDELLGRFYQAREASGAVRLRILDGPDAEEMIRLRARFARQRRKLARTDPERIARQFNYRQYEDTFSLEAGLPDLRSRLRARIVPRLLARRQEEMRAFGRFLQAEAGTTFGSRACNPESGTSRSSAP